MFSPQERLANIGPEEYVQTFIPRDEADLKVIKFCFDLLLFLMRPGCFYVSDTGAISYLLLTRK